MIQLRVLGTLDLKDSQGRDVGSVLRQPKLLALLLYLAVARPAGFHRRDTLVALLWPDLDHTHARNALRQAVHALRKALGHDVVRARGDDDLAVDERHLWCDAREFAAALEAHEPERALELYRGDLANGLHVSAVPQFERWIESERDHVRRQAIAGAQDLIGREDAAHNAVGAARWAHRCVAFAPHDETAAQDLIRRLDALGDRAGAVRAFEEFERRMARDLELEPSAEVRTLIKHIRATRDRPGPEAAGVAVASHKHEDAIALAPRVDDGAWNGHATAGDGVATPAPRRTRSLRLRQLLVLGAGIMTVAGGAIVLAGRSPARLDPHLLVVAPFEAPERELAAWRNALADLLTRQLDAVGPYRTERRSATPGRANGRANWESVVRLARRSGAGLALFGYVLRVGLDSVRITATLLDVREARAIQEFDRAEEASRMAHAADSLSFDVIRALMTMTPALGDATQSWRTKSLPAAKAYLQGEYHWRRFALDSAVASYERAIGFDGTWAVALAGAARARAWNFGPGPAAPYWLEAVAHTRGIDLRDSLMIVADSLSLADSASFARRRLAILRRALERHPDDPEIWFTLGDALFHTGLRGAWGAAHDAFDRVIALDPSYAPAYLHQVEIALRFDGPDVALRYARRYLDIPDVNRDGAGMQVLEKLLDPRVRQTVRIDRMLETLSQSDLYRLARAIQAWPDPRETQVTVARRLLANASSGRPGGPGIGFYVRQLSDVLAFRGHLREARSVVGSDVTLPAFMELARLGAIPADSVETMLSAWLERGGGPCELAMDAASWWAARGDTASLRRLVRREDSLASVAAGLGPDPSVRPVPVFARAALALALGDTAPALAAFVNRGDPLCYSGARPRREMQFRLLVAVERHMDAVGLFEWINDLRVPLMHERARLAERMADSAAAVKYYNLVVRTWWNPDVELEPMVNEARDALRRLGERDRRGR